MVDRSDLAVVCSACAMCEHTLICHLLCLMPVIVKVPAMPDDAGSQRTPIQDVSMCPTMPGITSILNQFKFFLI